MVHVFVCREGTRRPMRRTLDSKRILAGVFCGEQLRYDMSFGLTCPGREAVPRQYVADSLTEERDALKN